MRDSVVFIAQTHHFVSISLLHVRKRFRRGWQLLHGLRLVLKLELYRYSAYAFNESAAHNTDFQTLEMKCVNRAETSKNDIGFW